MSRAKDVYHQVQNTLVKALLPNAYELAKNLSLDFYKACL